MTEFLKRWGFGKHLLLSLVLSWLLNYIINIVSANPSVGVVGGSDGISSVFFSGSPSFLISSALFIVLLLIYKPVKKMIEKK